MIEELRIAINKCKSDDKLRKLLLGIAEVPEDEQVMFLSLLEVKEFK